MAVWFLKLIQPVSFETLQTKAGESCSRVHKIEKMGD